MNGSQRACPECGCFIQRTPEGSIEDGMRAHFATVHPGSPIHPAIRSNPT